MARVVTVVRRGFVLLNLLFLFTALSSATDFDPNGYILFCPCMGRFGNQADHFLGALAFARGLNRTLVLPPWVEYRTGESRSVQVPFDNYFKVEPLLKFHRVITMEKFMKELAPTIWPPGKRISLCYAVRSEGKGCGAKEGNPFGPFWDTFNVEFDSSEFYGPLTYDVHKPGVVEAWNKKFPPENYPVLAFTGAPGSFPIQEENRGLQTYLQWSDLIINKAKHFITRVLPKGPFVGIHLRNHIDWDRVCEHIESSPLLFASPQCLGYNGEKGTLTMEMCHPSKQAIQKQVKRAVRALKARAVFVASDRNFMINEINEVLKQQKVKAYKREPSDPHVDLAILGLANHFIGNCVSSFSAFVKRERDVHGLPTSFWAFPPDAAPKPKHEEL